MADFADSVSRVDYDNLSMQDGSIDKSDHDARHMGRGQTAYDEYDRNSVGSIPRNTEMNNGGFPINGPGEEGDIQS